MVEADETDSLTHTGSRYTRSEILPDSSCHGIAMCSCVAERRHRVLGSESSFTKLNSEEGGPKGRTTSSRAALTLAPTLLASTVLPDLIGVQSTRSLPPLLRRQGQLSETADAPLGGKEADQDPTMSTCLPLTVHEPFCFVPMTPSQSHFLPISLVHLAIRAGTPFPPPLPFTPVGLKSYRQASAALPLPRGNTMTCS
ncbi:hypothetical protein CP532_6750 [Ophiocordyceps camponoti-leonardi (nom. inval.)]|nr:hypothetical protein CP532_6750 [Ophiocordyceps camponoti-leonardi (nom. inval.)]